MKDIDCLVSINLNMADLVNLSDEEVVRKVIEDQEQYAELVKRYEEKLNRYVNYLIGSSDEASDVVQEAFIKAFVNLKGFDKKKGKFSSWIYRIAHNEAMNKVKKKKHLSLDFNDWLKEMLPGKVNIEKEYEKNEEKEMVKKCLTSLGFKYRSVLSLYYLEDKSYDEISEILKIPMGTVGIRLKRGKEKLRQVCSSSGGL
ncbi:RNA polymerase sigma factor [Patescibacteria group bacterium]|nr:RNA polymerase sigma factor [Patescibacteria group bacterium]